jgi:hypothetical protein
MKCLKFKAAGFRRKYQITRRYPYNDARRFSAFLAQLRRYYLPMDMQIRLWRRLYGHI